MTRSLVLGGGGPVGIAWETGVLAGLADGGCDVSGMDRIIGTSAGAIVGSQLACGATPRALFDRYRAAAAQLTSQASGAVPDLQPLFDFMMRRRDGVVPTASALAELGAYALRAATPNEETFLEEIGRLMPASSPWPASFLCTAIDAATGAFRVWDQQAGADLRRAVASSCAVPGLYPPITVGTARYIDGGMRSPTNADLARNSDAVLMLAVTVSPFADFMESAARRELAEVAAGHAALIAPDAASLAAFGASLMDRSRMGAALEAGYAQGCRARRDVAALF